VLLLRTHVLFTDLVGSTELASALTLEAATRLRRALLHASSGHRVQGTGVRTWVTVCRVPSRPPLPVMRCGMPAGRTPGNAERSDSGLRIGLSAGSEQEQTTYFGDAVIEAARLVEQATRQILAADSCGRWLVGQPARLFPVGAIESRIAQAIETRDRLGGSAMSDGAERCHRRHARHRTVIG